MPAGSESAFTRVVRQRPRGDRSWPPALIAELLAQTSRWLSDEDTPNIPNCARKAPAINSHYQSCITP
eukprot:1360583-Amphidinium_carterae.1